MMTSSSTMTVAPPGMNRSPLNATGALRARMRPPWRNSAHPHLDGSPFGALTNHRPCRTARNSDKDDHASVPQLQEGRAAPSPPTDPDTASCHPGRSGAHPGKRCIQSSG
jgi:hypothetical protein